MQPIRHNFVIDIPPPPPLGETFLFQPNLAIKSIDLWTSPPRVGALSLTNAYINTKRFIALASSVLLSLHPLSLVYLHLINSMGKLSLTCTQNATSQQQETGCRLTTSPVYPPGSNFELILFSNTHLYQFHFNGSIYHQSVFDQIPDCWCSCVQP